MDNQIKFEETRQRLEAAASFLGQTSVDLSTLKSLQTLVKGIHPKLDGILLVLVNSLDSWQKLGNGQIIDISAQYLPEETEPEKKRKKAVLFFLRNWNELKSEVGRVRSRLTQNSNPTAQNQIGSWAKITARAKGPLGLITLLAVVAVLGYLVVNHQTAKNPVPELKPVTKTSIKVLVFNGHQIPLSNLYIGTGSDCSAPHYHALDHLAALSVDGSLIADPGGCGFGKVSQTKIEEIVK